MAQLKVLNDMPCPGWGHTPIARLKGHTHGVCRFCYVVFSINNKGQIHWHKIRPRKQYDQI